MHYYYSIPFFFLITIILSTTTVDARRCNHSCTDKFYNLVKSKNISHCLRLPTLGAELGWSDPLSVNSHHVVTVVFGAPLEEEKGWLAWGVNPEPVAQMVGTRAAICIKGTSIKPPCNTYSLTHQTKTECSQLRPSVLKEIECREFEYDNATQYHFLTATLKLSSDRYNVSKLNIVWQIGSDADGDMPKKHAATLKNVDSVETLNLTSGECSDMALIKINLREVHGVMNILGWGTFLPVGVIIARFFREFPFTTGGYWYYTHVICQSTGFLIGAVGWGIGIWLAHNSPRYIFLTHHVVGIIIFVCATLQTLAIRFRPTKEDGFRKMWNIYHHFLGYALLGLIYFNIFQGIRILKPDNKHAWRFAVIGILVALGIISLTLEGYTWTKFLYEENKRKQSRTGSEEDQRRAKSSASPPNSPSMTPSRERPKLSENKNSRVGRTENERKKSRTGSEEDQRRAKSSASPPNSPAKTPQRNDQN